jgi:hypothetical protein
VIILSGHSTYLRLGGKLADARGKLSAVLLRKPFALSELRSALSDARSDDRGVAGQGG